jgi:hypothetical protein
MPVRPSWSYSAHFLQQHAKPENPIKQRIEAQTKLVKTILFIGSKRAPQGQNY